MHGRKAYESLRIQMLALLRLRPGRRVGKRVCLRVGLLLGGLGVSLGWVGCGPVNTYQPPPPVPVQIETATPRDEVVYDVFPGRTAAEDSVEVRARVDGFLASVHFEAGAMVEAGQLLYRIDPQPFQAAVEGAQGEWASAQASLELAETTLARQKELFDKKAVSELDFLRAKAERDKAAAMVQIAEATLEARRLDLSYTEITSAITGRTSMNNVSAGNLVGRGEATLLTTIVTVNPDIVEFELDERQLVRLLQRMGGARELPEAATAELEFTDGHLHPHKGRLRFIDNQVDPRTGTIQLEAVFDDPEELMLPGLFVRIRFPRSISGAITVPQTAVLRDLGGAYVLALNAEGVVEQRYVTTGSRVDDRIQITEGLSAGDRVVVTNLQRARPGSPVAVVEPSPTPDSTPSAGS